MMATQTNARPSWHSFTVATFAGSRDSHISTGEDYKSLSLASIFNMEPTDKPKMSGPAFLASSYCSYDARSHEAQRTNGSFVALVGDIDSGNLDISVIQSAAETFADGGAWLIYSSAHARADDQRWRIVFPLENPRPFTDWYDAQVALFTFLESRDIPVDHAMSRAGQPIYLPNVPFAYKDGTPLRDEVGDPIFYKSAHSDLNVNGLNITRGIVAGGISSIRQRRIADDREREALRKVAATKYANRAQDDGGNIMQQFNESTSVETMLALCDYKQSPADPRDWRSPHQTGDTYATRVIDGKWISLSASDAAAKLGCKFQAGCFGDAYDLLVHYKHGDDHKRAQRVLYNEQRGSNVVQGNFRGEADDPGWQEMPEWVQTGDEPDYSDDHIDIVPEPEKKLVEATPFAWRPTAEIPKRRWLYGKHLLRKFVSLDVAAGGVGKSSLKIGEALAMATGRDFYDKGLPEGALNVWMWNLEDPHDEIERRLHATAQRFKVTPDELSDRLYVDSGRDQPLVMATEGPDGAMIVKPVVEALIAEMLERKIDVLQIDPFISSHAVSENDNNAIDLVAREWNIVADRTGAAINLVHHVRKGNGIEATADSARGASSLIGKARSVQVYNRMSEDEAAKLNVPEDERFFYFRVDNDKANLAPPERGDWYRMNNEDLENGDSVGVACSWTPPDAFEGITVRHLYQVQKAISEGSWRENPQTKDAWAGNVVANVIGLDLDKKHERKRVQTLLFTWVRDGALQIVEHEDSKRMPRKFIEVARWAEL